MGVAIIFGLGLVLLMALGRGGETAEVPKKLPLPKKDEDLPDLQIEPYAYAQEVEEGIPGNYPSGIPGEASDIAVTSDEAIADAQAHGTAAEAAAVEAGAAVDAEAAAIAEMNAIQQSGAAQASAAEQAANQAASDAAAAAAESQAATQYAAQQSSQAASSSAQADTLESQGNAQAAEAARLQAQEAERKAEAARLAAMKAEEERQASEAREAEKRAEAERIEAQNRERAEAAAQAAQEANQRRQEAEAKAAEEAAAKQQSIEEARLRAEQEAEAKRQEAIEHAQAAKEKQQEATAEQDRSKAEEASHEKNAAVAAAKESKASKDKSQKLSVASDMEHKRQIIANAFKAAVTRRRQAVSSVGPTPSKPKKEDPEVAKKIAVVNGGLSQSFAYLVDKRQTQLKRKMTSPELNAFANANKVPIQQQFARNGVALPSQTTNLFWTLPLAEVKKKVAKAVSSSYVAADVKYGGGPVVADVKQLKGLHPVAKRQYPDVVAGYDFVGYDFVGAAAAAKKETEKASTSLVAAHFQRHGIDLGKPDPKKPFWKQPAATIAQKSLSAANTIPLPAGAQKPALVTSAILPPPPAAPIPTPPVPGTSAVHAPASNVAPPAALLEKNRVTIANAFKAALAKRQNAMPRESANARTGAVAAYFKSKGVPLDKPNPKAPHPMHAGDPKKVAEVLASIVNAFMPTTTLSAPAPTAKPAAVSAALLERNRVTIANAFKTAIAKRQKAAPREASASRTAAVASYFKGKGVPLDKPNPRAPHPMHAGDPSKVAQALATIVNAMPVPTPTAAPTARPTAPSTAKPAVVSSAILQRNQATIANAFKTAAAKRQKAAPREAANARTNAVASYFKSKGVPLGAPNPRTPHPLHAGDPSKVAAALASIVNAYNPAASKVSGYPYEIAHEPVYSYGSGLMTLGGWSS